MSLKHPFQTLALAAVLRSILPVDQPGRVSVRPAFHSTRNVDILLEPEVSPSTRSNADAPLSNLWKPILCGKTGTGGDSVRSTAITAHRTGIFIADLMFIAMAKLQSEKLDNVNRATDFSLVADGLRQFVTTSQLEDQTREALVELALRVGITSEDIMNHQSVIIDFSRPYESPLREPLRPGRPSLN